MPAALIGGQDVTDTPLPTPVTLADLRKAAGLSQGALAQRMGVKQPRVSQIEQDYPNLKFTVLSAYIEALGGHVALTGIAGHTVPASDVHPTYRDPESQLRRRRLQRHGLDKLDATRAAAKASAAEKLVLQGEQPHTSGNHSGGQVDHADAESDQGDGGQRQQP